jgi:hypothetical protein
MYPLWEDAEERDLGHIKAYQSLTDNMDSANNRDEWWNLSKLHWTARRRVGYIRINGVRYNMS